MVKPFSGPPADQLAADPGRPSSEPAAFAERQIQHEVEDEPVPDIEAAQGPFVLQIVGLVAGGRRSRPPIRASRSPSPRCRHVPGERVIRADEAAGAEALVGPELQRVVAALSRNIRARFADVYCGNGDQQKMALNGGRGQRAFADRPQRTDSSLLPQIGAVTRVALRRVYPG